jgi:hypothetical protein
MGWAKRGGLCAIHSKSVNTRRKGTRGGRMPTAGSLRLVDPVRPRQDPYSSFESDKRTAAGRPFLVTTTNSVSVAYKYSLSVPNF